MAWVLGAATVAGIALPAAAVAAPVGQNSGAVNAAPARVTGISIDVTTNVLDLTTKVYEIVSQSIAHNQNRPGYVKALMEGAFYDARQKYNVVVVKADHPYTANLSHVVYDATVHGSGYPSYRIMVFETGSFTNRGDGEFINWAYRGWFDRNGMTVTFRKP
jgi:hypothetical protein